MNKNEIPIEKKGSAFPNLAESNKFKFPQYDFNENEYIFQSNVFNDFQDHELDILSKDWELIKECKRSKVHIRLYKNPNYE